MSLNRSLIDPALGNETVDKLFINGKLVNVLSGEIYEEMIAVHNGYVVGFGNYDSKEIIDLEGAFIAPSFIDGHIHLESTLLTIPQFAQAVVPHGTCAVIADPHEYANVFGILGIEYLLKERERMPLDIFVMAPSCVPATSFETSGANLSANELQEIIENPRLIGLGEMMNYPGVIYQDEQVLEKLNLFSGCPIDGHAPGLSGKELHSYFIAGPGSEHEATTKEEALEKLRVGFHLHLREGSTEKNLRSLLPIVNANNCENFSFATDDRHPGSLINEGHIDNNVRISIEEGIDPILAFKMATINTAKFYGLKRFGAIAPGFYANFVIFNQIQNFKIDKVFYKGEIVVENGISKFSYNEDSPVQMLNSVRIKSVTLSDFEINALSDKISCIEIIPEQIVTKKIITNCKIENGKAVSDIENDILKLAVIERHNATGNVGLGFVKGFGLSSGAIGSSVGHDSHNLTIVGTNDRDMKKCAEHLHEIGGGYIIVKDGSILAELPLPIAGLVSDKRLPEVHHLIENLHNSLNEIGCNVPEPFSIMSFLPLTPIPEIRLTDLGLFDVTMFSFTDLFVK